MLSAHTAMMSSQINLRILSLRGNNHGYISAGMSELSSMVVHRCHRLPGPLEIKGLNPKVWSGVRTERGEKFPNVYILKKFAKYIQ